MGCPMGFGDLCIPSSRAFWDDCDEEDSFEVEAKRLHFTYTDNKLKTPIACSLLVVIEGMNVTEFANEAILRKNATKICDIPSKSSSLHRLTTKEGNVVLLVVIEEDLSKSGEITELLIPYVELAQELVTLTIKPKVTYVCDDLSKVCDEFVFFRGINSKLKYIEELQAPNFITGVAAGVASWRENINKAISSYVAYVDSSTLDTVISRPILSLLRNIGLECDKIFSSKVKDDSHLYC